MLLKYSQSAVRYRLRLALAALLLFEVRTPVEVHLLATIHQEAGNLRSEDDREDKIKPLDPRVPKLIRTYLKVFVELTPLASCDKLVQMDLKLNPGVVVHKTRRRPYPAPKEQSDEIERRIKECMDAHSVLTLWIWCTESRSRLR